VKLEERYNHLLCGPNHALFRKHLHGSDQMKAMSRLPLMHASEVNIQQNCCATMSAANGDCRELQLNAILEKGYACVMNCEMYVCVFEKIPRLWVEMVANAWWAHHHSHHSSAVSALLDEGA